MKWDDDILLAIIHSFALKAPQLFCSFHMVMWNSILAMFFKRHLRWIRSDVLSIRRAEKEWMAGRLPVKSLRVSTSSLACFCHKLLFAWTWSAHPLLALHSADLAVTCTIRLRMLAETVLLLRCVQPKTLEVDVFFGLYQSSPKEALRIGTSSTVLSQCHNLSCLVAESLHASTASKGFWLCNLELNSLL